MPFSVNLSRSARSVTLAHKFSIPLMVLLVGFGILFSQPVGYVRFIGVALLLFEIVFNVSMNLFVSEENQTKLPMVRVRLVSNFLCNVALVYLLGGYWPPIWLLLVLTPVTTAVYDSRVRTLVAAVVVSAILLIIHGLQHGLGGPLEWGQKIAQAVFIIFISLMVHALSRNANS